MSLDKQFTGRNGPIIDLKTVCSTFPSKQKLGRLICWCFVPSNSHTTILIIFYLDKF